MIEMNFEALKKNVTDVIKESQIKIGYSPNPVSLNYPVRSLNNLLGTSFSKEDIRGVMESFGEYVRAELGEVGFTFYEENCCITVPADGVKYIHENIMDSGFLTDFIGLLTTSRNINIDMILEVFRRYSDCVRCFETNNDEFNYVVYFENGIPDEYRYCIDIDLGHATYHRLTAEDYRELGFEDDK